MGIVNLRYQHPVGQGFFHSGAIYTGPSDTPSPALSYVYDCGAMETYAKARQREIEAYLKRVGAGSQLDFLFLSHAHADHVNGLPLLLDQTHGVRPDTIVMPLINVVERLFAFARTIMVDGASAVDAFYRDFVVDPGAALGRFEPRQIIYVTASGPEGTAPDGESSPREGFPFAPQGERGPSWKAIGRGRVSSVGSRFGVREMSDSIGISVAHDKDAWLLAPFIDPGVVAERTKFLAFLARGLGIALDEIDEWIGETKNVQDLVTNELSRVAEAYAEVSHDDLNLTSLSLYSGPIKNAQTPASRGARRHFGAARYYESRRAERIAWLGTGDADLKKKRHCDAFEAHYRHLLPEIGTFTLPHHGSDHNFSRDLFTRFEPDVCVAAADYYGNWKHPGSEVVRSVSAIPAIFHVVSSKKRSAMFEEVWLS